MKVNVEDFIKNHNHINYCEIIIFSDGRISNAYPSHSERLMKECQEVLGITKDELWETIPVEDNPMRWMVDKLNCVAVWYEQIFLSNNPTKESMNTLKVLLDNKIINIFKKIKE